MDQGVERSADILKPLIESIARGLERATDARSARQAIQRAVESFDPEDLDDLLFGTNVVAGFTGDLMVREGERGDPLLELARDDDPFVSLPWEEAVQEFKKRGRVTDRDLSTLLKTVENKTRDDRSALLQYVQETAIDKLAQAVAADDSTYESFAKDLRQDLVPLGINADDDSYLRMVFRTNVQSAYSAGRDRASKDPELLEQRPYARYLSVGDGLTRPEHREYAERNGGIYRIDSPEWELVRPPPKASPWNCRCSWVTLTAEQASRSS